MKIKKGITLLEVVVSIALLAIVSAIIVPKIMKQKLIQEQRIIEIYNNETKTICIFDNHEISEEESKNYKLDRIEYEDGIIYKYFVLE